MRKLLIVLLLCQSFSSLAQEAGKDKYGHITGGVGILYNSYWGRIGRNNWEIGFINFVSLGVAKIMPVNKWFRGIFGVGYYNGGMSMYGGADFKFFPIGAFSGRFSTIAMATTRGLVRGDLLLGIEISI